MISLWRGLYRFPELSDFRFLMKFPSRAQLGNPLIRVGQRESEPVNTALHYFYHIILCLHPNITPIS
jgi:hypothetical protein